MSCDGLPDAFLDARIAGAIDAGVHWQATALQCDGMRRPDGKGLRVTFTGAVGHERLTLVFGVPRLAEGSSGRAVPVNVTIIREGGRVYGTRGEGKCVLDEVTQAPLIFAAAEADAASQAGAASRAGGASQAAVADRPGAAGQAGAAGQTSLAGEASMADPSATAAVRHWRIDARGFCLEPARAVAAGSAAGDAILLTRFDFRGQLAWEPDPPEPPAGTDRAPP
jgi:hypothetical protein